jgi:Na+/melibiose symporter-like transporter
MIETILAVGLLYLLPIFYQARTKFKKDKLTLSSSIISSVVVVTGVYLIFGVYFYILNSIMNYFINLQLNGFIIFIIGALIVVGGVFLLMFTIIKVLGFLDKKLTWK